MSVDSLASYDTLQVRSYSSLPLCEAAGDVNSMGSARRVPASSLFRDNTSPSAYNFTFKVRQIAWLHVQHSVHEQRKHAHAPSQRQLPGGQMSTPRV